MLLGLESSAASVSFLLHEAPMTIGRGRINYTTFISNRRGQDKFSEILLDAFKLVVPYIIDIE